RRPAGSVAVRLRARPRRARHLDRPRLRADTRRASPAAAIPSPHFALPLWQNVKKDGENPCLRIKPLIPIIQGFAHLIRRRVRLSGRYPCRTGEDCSCRYLGLTVIASGSRKHDEETC